MMFLITTDTSAHQIASAILRSTAATGKFIQRRCFKLETFGHYQSWREVGLKLARQKADRRCQRFFFISFWCSVEYWIECITGSHMLSWEKLFAWPLSTFSGKKCEAKAFLYKVTDMHTQEARKIQLDQCRQKVQKWDIFSFFLFFNCHRKCWVA